MLTTTIDDSAITDIVTALDGKGTPGFFASRFEVHGSSPECIDGLHFLKWCAFLHSGSVHGVFPVSLRLELAIGLTSSGYGLRVWSIHLLLNSVHS